VNIYLAAIGRQYRECLDWSAAVIRQLHAMPRTFLIIDARTSTYLPQVLDSNGETVSSPTAAKLWGAGFAIGVADLKKVASRVVVLRDTPHAPQDIPACVSWNESHPAECIFARTPDGHSDDAEYAAERAAGVASHTYADPAPAVCGPRWCEAVVGGIITYRDDNHLTAAYAAAIWRRYAQAISIDRERHSI
jgi:hypothetical protein